MLSGYCWPHSGAPGAAIPLCISSSLGAVNVTVTRVGARREVVARIERLVVDEHRVPDDVVASDCGWPVAAEIATEPGWPSGFYEVMLATVGCTEWACGLGVGDHDVEQVTHNLLTRLG